MKKKVFDSSKTDTIFLTFFGIYIFLSCLGTTTFNIAIHEWFYYGLLIPLMISAICRLFMERKNISIWQMLFEIIVFTGYVITFVFTGYQFLLFLAAITIGMTNMDYRKPMKVFIAAALLVLVVAIVGSMSGAIENLVYSRGRGTRSAMGISYPTDLASYLLFMCIAIYAVYHKSVGMLLLPVMVLPVILAIYVADSRTTMITGGLFLVIVLLNALFEKLNLFSKKWFKNLFAFLEMIAFPLCAAAFLAVVYLYVKNNYIGYKLNSILSNRPKYTFEAYKIHGIALFGNQIEMIGFGRSRFNDASYNFVDSSYPLMLIRYGIVVFSIVTILWMYLCGKVNKYGKTWIGMILALIAIHSISEHHFTELNYNLFLALPFASFEGEDQPFKKINIWRFAVGVLLASLLIPVAPFVFSVTRTFFDVFAPTGTFSSVLTFIGISIVVLSLVFTALNASAMIYTAIRKKPVNKKQLPVFLSSLAIPVLSILLMFAAVKVRSSDYTTMVNNDREAIEAVVSSRNGHVYADKYPLYYQSEFKGISSTLFTGEELAQLDNITVITDPDEERNIFIKDGYLYCQISDETAIYTSDDSVIRSLREQGYHLTGYYNTIHYVDLEKETEYNTYQLGPDGEAVINGSTESIAHGVRYDLYTGKYTATYKLNRIGSFEDNDVVCVLRVTENSTRDILAQKEILGRHFSSDGTLESAVEFNAKMSSNVEFLVLVNGDNRLSVSEVSFQRTPDVDTHITVNRKGQTIKSESYSISGDPIINENGYFGVEYEYDSNGNRIVTSYYSEYGNLMMTNYGYAKIHREFNERKQVVLEEYYGIDDNLILSSKGYAILKREYEYIGNVEKRKEYYYGLNQEPVTLPAGYAAREREYSEEGQFEIYRYYDASDNPVITTSGYAGYLRQFDSNKNPIHIEYYGTDGKLAIMPKGYAIIEREYDRFGNVTLEKYLDTDWNPVMITSGYAIRKREYNMNNQLVREEYYDAEGHFVMIGSGYAIQTMEYDDKGNLIVRRYFDANGEFIKNKIYD